MDELMTCDQTTRIHAYHDGELPKAERPAVEAHLLGCMECQQTLRELRRLSLLLRESPMADLPAGAISRLVGAWNVRRDRELRRLAWWMTAAAAAAIVYAVIPAPAPRTDVLVRTATWQIAPVIPAVEPRGDAASETLQLAQWMADDLGRGAAKESP